MPRRLKVYSSAPLQPARQATCAAGLRYVLPFQDHDLTNPKLTGRDHRTVHAGVIVV